MLTRLCLFVQILCGVGAVAVFTVRTHIAPLDAVAIGKAWINGLSLFGIPICLIVLGLKSSKPIDWMHVIWGLWSGGLSVGVLIQVAQGYPPLSDEGKFMVALYLAVSLAIVVSAARSATRTK